MNSKNKKQGVILTDVAVALAIFLILSIIIFSFLKIGNKYFNASKEKMRNSSLIEAVSRELKYNLNLNKCKEKFYINKTNLSMDTLKDNSIDLLIDTNHDGNEPYIEVNILKTDYYKIKYLWVNKGEQINGEIYRKK